MIDSGVAEVPELRGRIVVSVDFTGASKKTGQALRGSADCVTSSGGVISRPGDQNGHGTHVAGIIAAAGARKNDSTRGVAPGAHIISLKVLDADGGGYAGDVVEAIEWAIANRERFRIRVLNLSLGGPVLQAYADDPVNRRFDGPIARDGRGGVGSNRGRAEGTECSAASTVPGNSPFAITVGPLTPRDAFRSDDEITTTARGGRRGFASKQADLVAAGEQDRRLLAPGQRSPRVSRNDCRHRRREAACLSGTSMAFSGWIGDKRALLQGVPNFSPFAVRFALQWAPSALPGGGAWAPRNR